MTHPVTSDVKASQRQALLSSIETRFRSCRHRLRKYEVCKYPCHLERLLFRQRSFHSLSKSPSSLGFLGQFQRTSLPGVFWQSLRIPLAEGQFIRVSGDGNPKSTHSPNASRARMSKGDTFMKNTLPRVVPLHHSSYCKSSDRVELTLRDFDN